MNGKDVYLGAHGTKASRAAYDRTIAEWLANGRRLGWSNDRTISELVVPYLAHVDARYTSNEPRNIRLALRPLQEHYGMTLARDFGPLALKTVRKAFLEGNLSRGEVNKRTRRIIRMFKWAVSEQMIAPDVHLALKTVEGVRRGQARETTPVQPVADTLVDAVKPHVSRQIWAMIELQRLTGARPGEICIMRTCDLVTTGKVWEYRPASHKTANFGKSRVIFIGPQGQQVLRPWLRTHDAHAYLFQPREAVAEYWKAHHGHARRRTRRPNRLPGDHYRVDSYREAISRACDRAFPCPEGQDLAAWQKSHRWHPHQLRHSLATRVRREFGLDTARAILGHTSVVTSATYAELDQAKASQAMGKIG